MPIGTPLIGIIPANAIVTVEAAASNPTGGTVPAWTPIVSGVDVIVSQASGERAFGEGTLNQRGGFSVTGLHPSLGRADIRLLVTATDNGLKWLVDRYLSVVSGGPHPAGIGGLIPARVSLSCTILELPMDTGSAL